ncbi:MAG: N-formylglutamate amidohydrolase [Pseudomonadota bacterium]
MTPPFDVAGEASQSTPLVLCSPHSGAVYTDAFKQASKLDPDRLRKSEDCFVDDLFSGALDHGAVLLSARFPRAYLDVNREPFELDPLLISPIPAHANTSSIRVAGGLGTIARIVAEGEEIYGTTLPLSVAMARIDHLYRPFHAKLRQLLNRTASAYGHAVLIDCHSMPSSVMSTAIRTRGRSAQRPDIILGDRHGSSCEPGLIALVQEAFQKAGFEVHRNRPYAGGYITEHYGRPHRDTHALQIELNRGLYLDERRFQRTTRFAPLRGQITQILGEVVAELPALFGGRMAAE